jgi:hypothetical protein
MPTHAQRDRLVAALAQMSADDLNTAIAGLGDGEHMTNLAQVLNVKKPALKAHPDPQALLRARVRTGGPGRAAVAALEVAGSCVDACIDDLGDRADDPSRDDMLEVLPPLVEEFGAKVVTLMLAAYVAIDAPCGDVFDELLDTDERFVIGDPSPDATAAPTAAAGARSEADLAEIAAKKARRKEADAAKKEAARKARDAKAAAAAALKAARKQKG